jgi:RNA polymerase sigma factor (sigma-70 family)
MSKDFSGYTDTALWQAFISGDDDAFENIYSQHAPLLYNYGRHMLKNRQLVEDCIHDLFVYIHHHRASLGTTNSIKYYLFRALRRRIAENIATYDIYSDEADTVEGYNFEIISSPESQLIEHQSTLFQHEELTKAMNLLPRRQREVLYLLYFNELSYKEVASIMSLETRTVYNQVHNALQTLKKHLNKSHIFLFITLLLISFFNF